MFHNMGPLSLETKQDAGEQKEDWSPGDSRPDSFRLCGPQT